MLTVSFALQDTDKWNEGTPSVIEESVIAYRHAIRPSPKLPIQFSVVTEKKHVHGMATYELQAKLRSSAERVKRLVTLKFDGVSSSDPNRIEISEESIAIRLANMPVITVHTGKESFIGSKAQSLPEDILLMLGLGFDWIGHSGLGASIFEATQLNSAIATNIEVAWAIARCFSRARRLHDALRLAERLMETSEYIPVAHVYLTHIASSEAYAMLDEHGLEILERIASSLATRGYKETAAALHYSRANFASQAGQFRKAIRYYRMARKLDPSYLLRGYYQTEVAGTNFMNGRFRAASLHYGLALQLRSDRSVQLRLADALLFSGDYRVALEMFDTSLKHSSDLSEAEWLLKSLLIDRIIAAAGQPYQIRKRNALPSGFDPKSMGEEEIRSTCAHALRLDALCSLAWFNLGGVASRAGDLDEALYSFLIAASLQRDDTEAWANAVAIALNAKRSSKAIEGADLLATLGLVVGYKANGEDFLLHMTSRAPVDGRESFMSMVRRLISEIPRADDPPPIVRFVLPDGSWNVLPGPTS